MFIELIAVVSAATLLLVLIYQRSAWFSDIWSTLTIAAMIGGGVLYDSTWTNGSRILQAAILLIVLLATVGQTISMLTSKAPWQARIVSGFIPLAIASYMVLVSGLQNREDTELGLVLKFGPVLLWLLIGCQLAMRGLSYQVLVRVVPVVMCCIGMSLPIVDEPWRACDQFKCGVLDQLLLGQFTSENYLGELAAIALLVFLFNYRGSTRISGLLLTTIVLAGTGSRTSQTAALAGVILGLIVIARQRRTLRVGSPSNRAIARGLVWGVVAGSMVAGVALLYVASPGSFSNRASIWSRGVAVLGDMWPLGLGNEAWVAYQATGVLPDHYPHSQYLLLLFWGGLVGLGLFGVAIAVSVIESADYPPALPSCVAMAACLILLGFTEAFWNPLAVDGHSFMILTVLMAAQWAKLNAPQLSSEPVVKVPRHKTDRQDAKLMWDAASPSRSKALAEIQASPIRRRS